TRRVPPLLYNLSIAGCIIGAFIMTDSEIMNALQSKLDAQAATLQEFLNKALESHSDSIHTTLHQHLLEVDSKVANVRSEPKGSSHGSGNAVRSLKLNWAMRNNLLTSWPVFLDAVRIRFGPTTYEDVEGDLSKLSQTGSVAEFQAQFEDLMNK
ncbi:hypothetical protein A2U01_0041313, partial [Trifolium medium]|nr:hypothetical protein [Trifolium medium]